MYCIGLTGNIASGKSTVIKCFRSLGIQTISADQIARELTRSNEPAFALIKNHFGEQVINNLGELNRPLLRKLIFASVEHRLWLENLLHPLIRKAIEEKISANEGAYCVIEIPLLKNRRDYPYIDRILVVIADREKQVERIMKRDNCTAAEALSIIATQPNESSRQELADDLIINNDCIDKLLNVIKKLHYKYLHFASEKSS